MEIEGGHYSVYNGPGAEEAGKAATDCSPSTSCTPGVRKNLLHLSGENSGRKSAVGPTLPSSGIRPARKLSGDKLPSVGTAHDG